MTDDDRKRVLVFQEDTSSCTFVRRTGRSSVTPLIDTVRVLPNPSSSPPYTRTHKPMWRLHVRARVQVKVRPKDTQACDPSFVSLFGLVTSYFADGSVCDWPRTQGELFGVEEEGGDILPLKWVDGVGQRFAVE